MLRAAVPLAGRVLVRTEDALSVPLPSGERLRQRHLHLHQGRHAAGESRTSRISQPPESRLEFCSHFM